MDTARQALHRDIAAGVHSTEDLVGLARFGEACTAHRDAYRPLSGAALAAEVVRATPWLTPDDLRSIASAGVGTAEGVDELAAAIQNHGSCSVGALVELLLASHWGLAQAEFDRAAAAVAASGRSGSIAAAVARASSRVLQPTRKAVEVAEELQANGDQDFVAAALCLLAEATAPMDDVLAAARACTA